MDKKYAFRFYTLDNNGDLISPYLSGHTENAAVHKLGSTYTDDKKTIPSHDELFINVPKASTISRTPPNAAHSGYSVLGLPDTKYSTYSMYDLFTPIYGLSNEAGKYLIDNADKEDLDVLYNDRGKPLTPKDIVDHVYGQSRVTNSLAGTNALMNVLYKLQNKNKPGYGTLTAYGMQGSKPDISKDRQLQQLLREIVAYTEDLKDNGSDGHIALVQVPTDKLVSIDDAIREGTSLQRDTPEELIARELTPTSIYDSNKIYDVIKDAENKAGKMANVNAADVINDMFKLSPDDIVVSDAAKKTILTDMSNDYNALLKQKNIKDTLIDCSRY